MSRTLLTILILLTAAASPAEQHTSLVPVGEGTIRYLGFFKVYDAILYAPPATRRNRVLAESTSRCLEIRYAMALSAEDIIAGARTILQRQVGDELLERNLGRLGEMHANLRNVDSGDVYLLCYDAASQASTLELNGTPLARVDSPEFAALYFGIWLGAVDPIDADLRDDLLAHLD